MTLCVRDGGHCMCQPDEGVWCPSYRPDPYVQCLMDAITELRRDAERYRFIRTEASHSVNGAWAKIVDPSCNAEDMDAAIDKAMSSAHNAAPHAEGSKE